MTSLAVPNPEQARKGIELILSGSTGLPYDVCLLQGHLKALPIRPLLTLALWLGPEKGQWLLTEHAARPLAPGECDAYYNLTLKLRAPTPLRTCDHGEFNSQRAVKFEEYRPKIAAVLSEQGHPYAMLCFGEEATSILYWPTFRDPTTSLQDIQCAILDMNE